MWGEGWVREGKVGEGRGGLSDELASRALSTLIINLTCNGDKVASPSPSYTPSATISVALNTLFIFALCRVASPRRPQMFVSGLLANKETAILNGCCRVNDLHFQNEVMFFVMPVVKPKLQNAS